MMPGWDFSCANVLIFSNLEIEVEYKVSFARFQIYPIVAFFWSHSPFLLGFHLYNLELTHSIDSAGLEASSEE